MEQFTEPFYQRVALPASAWPPHRPDAPGRGSDELLRRLDIDELAAL